MWTRYTIILVIGTILKNNFKPHIPPPHISPISPVKGTPNVGKSPMYVEVFLQVYLSRRVEVRPAAVGPEDGDCDLSYSLGGPPTQ